MCCSIFISTFISSWYILIKAYDHQLSRSALAVARTHVDGLQVKFNAKRLKLKQDIDELKCSSQEIYNFNQAKHMGGCVDC